MKRKIILCASILVISMRVSAQCPTSGTISADCTTVGDLTVSGTLNINPGVTYEVTGRITYTGHTINASGAIIEAGSMREQWASSTLNGGTYNVAGDFTTSGDFFSIDITANIGGDLSIGGNSTSHTNSNYNVDGDLSFGSGPHELNGTSFDVGIGYAGTTGTFVVSLNGSSILNFSNGASMDVRGDVDAGSGAQININASDVYVTGNFDNSGTGSVTVTNGGTFKVDGDYDNSGTGHTTVEDGGTLEVGGDFDNSGGGSELVVDGGGVVVGGDFEGNDPDVTGGADAHCSGGGGGCCGAACSAMPVSLISFDAQAMLDHVALSWSTASELNNDHFNIHRSTNGVDFEIIDWKAGHGTTNEKKKYELKDYPTQKGIYYYQLEQVDYDGTNEFFPIKEVNFNLGGQEQISIYPVPFIAGDDFYVSFPGHDQTSVTAKIYDLSGGLSMELPFEIGERNIKVNSSELGIKPGVYVIKISTSNKLYTKKFRVI
ncbi:MAG: T9SS type A sorting domain-containing protein [Reichenbachiella sp.]|uniref:T9SS type A sorting domain-containing protein n=1 Tax=Reichenbachiella sp. TaxID=2184521 RepID=UPI0029667260|nr:T9SS type A sorting domain-containing protein [Reichenbachiella sp.]MDW3208685.1 T9SS type A sorting domain-containing protein [Reichenbachiella sp.]